MTAPGTFAPSPGRAPYGRMLARQASMEAVLTLRRGESVLLTLVIPLLILVGVVTVDALRLPTGDRVGFAAPGVLALAVMSVAFTGQAIATGYERFYGVLKRLGSTALPRWGLVVAKTAGVLAVLAIQVVVIVTVAVLMGWRPAAAGIPAAVALVALATVGFSGLGLLMAGTLRAEATLAGANLVYLLTLAASGVIVPIDGLPAAAREVFGLLPLTALVDGLRTVLTDGGVGPLQSWLVLLVWAVLGVGGAARFFRWE